MHAGSGVNDASYLAERKAYMDCCQTGVDLTTETICDDFRSWRPACSDELFPAPSASKCLLPCYHSAGLVQNVTIFVEYHKFFLHLDKLFTNHRKNVLDH